MVRTCCEKRSKARTCACTLAHQRGVQGHIYITGYFMFFIFITHFLQEIVLIVSAASSVRRKNTDYSAKFVL